MKRSWITAPIVGLVLASTPAMGQDEQPEPVPTPEPKLIDAPQVEATFSDEDIARAAQMLTGIWTTSEKIGEFGGEGESRVIMSIGPAKVAGMTDVLYCELARADDSGAPYRQALYQLYRFEEKLRLRTFDIRSTAASDALIGMAVTPEIFPETLTAADFYPTMDIDLELGDDMCQGKSPGAFPDHRGGAVQMISAIGFDGNMIKVSDTGYGSDGQVAWSVENVEFARADDAIAIDYYDDGLVVLHFDEPEGEPIADGQWFVVHYIGKLADGTKFDASYDRGEPFRYQYPGTLIQGWMRGVEGMTKGSKRRFIIPPELGYGQRSVSRIPPNSTLIFDIECVFIEEPAPEPVAEPAAQPAADAPEGD